MTKLLKKNYFWLFPIIITVVMLLLNLVGYTEVDDMMMSKMAGSFGFNDHSEYLMFLSEAYGYLIKALYRLIPAVNWFAALYIFTLNLSYISILKVISKKTENAGIIAVILAMQVFMLLDISFSVIAFILCAAGMLWGIEFVDKLNKKNIKHIIYAFFLFFCGFSMRNGSVLYCIILIFLPLLIFSLKNKKNAISSVCVILAVCLASSFAVQQIHKSYRASIPSDSYYSEFNEYRDKASDGGKLSYAEHEAYYLEKGVSKTDFRLFAMFIYADKEVYSNETFKTFAESRDTNDKYVTNPVELIKTVLSPNTVLHCVFLYLFALAAVILFILYKKKRLEIFVSALFTAAAEGYLFFVRRGVSRVVNPIAIIGTILLIYIISSESNPFENFKLTRKLELKRITSLAIALTVALSVASVGVYSIYRYKNSSFNSAAYEYVNKDEENIYVCSPSSYYLLNNNKLSLLNKESENGVYDIIGDWWSYTYYWYSALDKAELNEYKDNAIKCLLDSRVRFITNYDFLPDLLQDYYKEHYNIDVSVVKLDEINGLFVYNLIAD